MRIIKTIASLDQAGGSFRDSVPRLQSAGCPNRLPAI